ncbi:MAG: folate family ECF transporter S component [Aerococcus sp.]|nr:folate family ECF transporter S component [Aerococcus sp.]
MSTSNNKRFRFTPMQMALVALFMALNIVLTRFSIPIGQNNRISFGFLSTVFLGFFFGPWVAGFASAGNDLLKSFLFGASGGFFFGFTFNAFLGGVFYGFFLHRKEVKWYHVLGAVLCNTIITNIILGTLWLHIMYGTPMLALLATRVPQNIIMGAVRFVVMLIVINISQFQPYFDKYRTV